MEDSAAHIDCATVALKRLTHATSLSLQYAAPLVLLHHWQRLDDRQVSHVSASKQSDEGGNVVDEIIVDRGKH